MQLLGIPMPLQRSLIFCLMAARPSSPETRDDFLLIARRFHEQWVESMEHWMAEAAEALNKDGPLGDLQRLEENLRWYTWEQSRVWLGCQWPDEPGTMARINQCVVLERSMLATAAEKLEAVQQRVQQQQLEERAAKQSG